MRSVKLSRPKYIQLQRPSMSLKLSAHYTKADNSATGYGFFQGYIM